MSNLDGIYLDSYVRACSCSQPRLLHALNPMSKQSSKQPTTGHCVRRRPFLSCLVIMSSATLWVHSLCFSFRITEWRMEKKKAHQRGWVCKNARYGFSISSSLPTPPLSHDLPRSLQDSSGLLCHTPTLRVVIEWIWLL